MPLPACVNKNAIALRSPHGRKLVQLAMAFVVLLVCQAWAQEDSSVQNDETPERSAREHFVLKFGSLYEQGDFDTPSTTRVFFAPMTLRFNGEKFDISATPSVGFIRSSGGVVLVDGTPTPTNRDSGPLQSVHDDPVAPQTSAPSQTWGIGDTVIKSRIFLVDDPGPESPLPAITPFFKVKIPTGDAATGLSTGATDYGFGVELDKQINSVLLFGDVGYTFIGKVAGLDLRNRPLASFGLGKRASDALTVSAMLDWRRALVAQTTDPLELVGVVSYKASSTTTISPNFFVGLTNGSSSFGAGVEFAFKFGRF